MLVVSITLAPSVILTSKSSLPVSDLPFDNIVLIFWFLTFGVYASVALSANRRLDSFSSSLLLCSFTGSFSTQM